MISWRDMRGPVERSDKVSWVSYSGVGLSRRVSQWVSGGTWFVSDAGASGRATELFVVVGFDGVERDSTVLFDTFDMQLRAGTR